jgi:hypothetical protein
MLFLQFGTLFLTSHDALQNAQQNLPSHPLSPPPIDFGRRHSGSKSRSDRHTGTSRIQPTNMETLTDMWQWPVEMWGQHYELRFQPLKLYKDSVRSNRGPTVDLPSTTISPVIALPPPPQIPSSMVDPRLPQLRHGSRDLPLSSHVFSAGNVGPDDISHEATLRDLSKYITKDGDYPVARGGFGEIWKCTFRNHCSSVKVRLPSFVCSSI